MGARGPLAQPSNIRALKGNPSHSTPKTNIKAKPSLPEPEHDLSPVARAEWDRMVNHLDQLGALGELDRVVLTQQCETYELNRQLHAMVLADIDGARQTTGNTKSLWQMYQETVKTLITLSKELLATPMSRARTPAPEVESGDSDFFD